MNINVTHNSQFMVLSTVSDGQRYEMKYNGYTVKQAKQKFREYVKAERAKEFYNQG